MIRVKSNAYSSLIEAGYARMPGGIRHLLRDVDFFTGTDPIFAGLGAVEDSDDGRSLRSTSHCAYAHNQGHLPKALRRTTVVLPEPAASLNPYVVVHELGHVLHEIVGFEYDFKPINAYAATNWCEAFAEIFCQWCWWNDIADREATVLFQGLED